MQEKNHFSRTDFLVYITIVTTRMYKHENPYIFFSLKTNKWSVNLDSRSLGTTPSQKFHKRPIQFRQQEHAQVSTTEFTEVHNL